VNLRRIERWMDGEFRPASRHEPQLTSARERWSGFLVERDPCRGGSADIAYAHTELVMIKSGSVSIQDGGRRYAGGPGSINIWPGGYESRTLAWSTDGPTEIISVQLDPPAMRLLVPECEALPMAMQPVVDDAALTALMSLMEREVEGRCEMGRLYGESLCLALFARVRSQYGIAKSAHGATRPGLSRHASERVREYVQAHLDADLCLAKLALVVELSPQHFAIAFRTSFGTTPHQYVLRQRIEHAKRALHCATPSIADVAFSLGFATQSHFTAVFRRVVGVTPRRYRDSV
jgi:AraC family transcriptional regulator